MFKLRNLFEVMVLWVNFWNVISLLEESKIEKCIIHYGNRHININVLNSKTGYKISSENKTYFLNICGPAPNCKDLNVAACEVHGNDIIPIGLLNKTSLNGHLKYGSDKKKVFTIIKFVCKRHLTTPHIYLQRSGKKHEFIFETPVACVKQPTICKILNDEQTLQYDISSLNNVNTNWIVKNVPNDSKIYLNLCGNLLMNFNATNECLYNGTQICLIDSQGNNINLGVFSTELQASDDRLSINFIDGSLCENSTTVTSKIDFICSFNDSGPVLLNNSPCEYNIVWHTPAACPFENSVNDNCVLSNNYFPTNIPLNKSQTTEQKTPNFKIKYNICGSLNENCHNQRNVSFCLIQKEKEIVLGKTNRTVISLDADVYMHLTGEKCENSNKNWTVNILFQCDYTPNKREKIIFIEDWCEVNVTVFTKSTCLLSENSEENCQISINNTHYYDFSQLSLKDRNYEIIDPDDKTKVYLINICQPLILNSNAICQPDSAICLRDNSEPNKYNKRFISLGNYLKFEIQNKNEIHYDGQITASEDKIDYTSIIKFECVSNQNTTISVSKFGSVYTFIVKSQFACPIENITDQNLKQINDESTEDNIEVIEVKDIIKQTIKPSSTTTTTITTTATATATTTTTATTIISPTFRTAEKIEKDNIIVTNRPQNLNKNLTVSMYVPNEIPNMFGIFVKNCTLKNQADESNKFNLHLLPNTTTIYSKSGKLYSLNICVAEKQVFCKSFRCLTNSNITQDDKFIIANFKGQRKCNNGSYVSTLVFKCSEQLQLPTIIKEEECFVHLEWNNLAACSFLKSHKTELHSATTTIIIITSVFILISLSALAFYYLWYRRRNMTYMTSNNSFLMHRFSYTRVRDNYEYDKYA